MAPLLKACSSYPAGRWRLWVLMTCTAQPELCIVARQGDVSYLVGGRGYRTSSLFRSPLRLENSHLTIMSKGIRKVSTRRPEAHTVIDV